MPSPRIGLVTSKIIQDKVMHSGVRVKYRCINRQLQSNVQSDKIQIHRAYTWHH